MTLKSCFTNVEKITENRSPSHSPRNKDYVDVTPLHNDAPLNFSSQFQFTNASHQLLSPFQKHEFRRRTVSRDAAITHHFHRRRCFPPHFFSSLHFSKRRSNGILTANRNNPTSNQNTRCRFTNLRNSNPIQRPNNIPTQMIIYSQPSPSHLQCHS